MTEEKVGYTWLHKRLWESSRTSLTWDSWLGTGTRYKRKRPSFDLLLTTLVVGNVNPRFCWHVFKHVLVMFTATATSKINPPPFCCAMCIMLLAPAVRFLGWLTCKLLQSRSFLQSQRHTFCKIVWLNYDTSKENSSEEKLGKNTFRMESMPVSSHNLIHTKQPSKTTSKGWIFGGHESESIFRGNKGGPRESGIRQHLTGLLWNKWI